MRGFCGRRAQKGDVTSLGLFRRRASGVPARPVFRRRRGTAVLVALSIVCFAPFSRYYHALSIEHADRSAYAGAGSAILRVATVVSLS